MRTPFRAPAPASPSESPNDPFRRHPQEPRMRSYESSIRPAALPARPPSEPLAPATPQAAPAEPAPPRRPRVENSFIDRHTTIEGKLRSSQDLRVEGRVDGEILCDGKLTIAEGAVVQARVEAAEVIVSGAVEGDVVSHGQFKLQPSGSIRGSAIAARIAIEDGATYEGELHMAAGAEPAEAGPDGVLPAAGRNGKEA